MAKKKVWFITGAGRGMGADFAKAALAAGHQVVATGRSTDAVSKALAPSDDLLTVKLDVTKRGDAEEAARAAVDGFGRIDVLVNNAASFTAFTMLNIAVFAPTPKARESTATIVKPGLFQSTRSAYRISCNNVVIQTPSSG
jgi:NAD(P)-dependent dehydrogenase (short-subunit alcohol dehydrogenase family)